MNMHAYNIYIYNALFVTNYDGSHLKKSKITLYHLHNNKKGEEKIKINKIKSAYLHHFYFNLKR